MSLFVNYILCENSLRIVMGYSLSSVNDNICIYILKYFIQFISFLELCGVRIRVISRDSQMQF